MENELFVKPRIFIVVLCLGLFAQLFLFAAPVVSNVHTLQRTGTQLVDIYYDLASLSNSLTISMMVSTNGGTDYMLPASSFTGAVGAGIPPGTNQRITWNAGKDWPTNFSASVRFRVTADDAVPSGMALVPAGSFTMGNCMDPNEGNSDELPLHTVYISAFYMDKNDETKSFWDSVYSWAIMHGYNFDFAGSGKAANHPVQTIDWYDMVKWCNARSEKEGMIPAYYTNAAQTGVYRSGQVDVADTFVKWSSGYRLPTEAEWEKAARGGLSGQRFPWGGTILWSQANYYASPSSYSYDVNPTSGFDLTFATGGFPYTSPVGYFAPNGYGLYDMAGSTWQWCWDWWGTYGSVPQIDPHGPISGPSRVLRGGNWLGEANSCRTSGRAAAGPTGSGLNGFRAILPPGDLPVITVQPLDRIVSRGTTTMFSVTATGGTPLYYQWQLNGVNIASATAVSLTITNVQSAGFYSVVISNGLGVTTSRSAHLIISGGIGEQ